MLDRRNSPKRLLATALAASLAAATSAQQASQNISVLPVVPDDGQVTAEGLPLASLEGDLFLQRQVEPTIAVSTRNPDHLLAFFNDYRAVDIPDDVGIGGNTGNLADASDSAETDDNPLVAAAEAFIGMSRSYDGGRTWVGGFLPGSPFDESPASLASPIRGVEAATDPVLVSGPCGYFHLAGIAFTRGAESNMFVATYRDTNDTEGGDTIRYLGTTIVESGNNAEFGFFLDKPDAAVDVARGNTSDACEHSVYLSYTTFNGQQSDGKFRSKVNFAKSTVGDTFPASGLTFSTKKLNMPFNQNQGTAIAVAPNDGTVYLIWRHFFDPDQILMLKSTNGGNTFPGQPDELITGLPMASFDQPSAATTAVADPVTQVTLRSNGFPAATVTGDGTLYVGWQERVDIDPGSASFGEPMDGGSPRIVLIRSTNGGNSFTDILGNSGSRRAVDLADRDTTAQELGLGLLPQLRASGPQIMPRLSYGAGRLLLAYYESRGVITGPDSISPLDVSPTTSFISGIDRVLDFRAAVLDPATGQVLSSTQVSRYPLKAGADLSDGESLEDVYAVNAPCSPDFGSGLPTCVRRVNRANAPQSASGTTPFLGDYAALVPSVRFVPDGGGWRWATENSDVANRSFWAMFADNRNLIPPTLPSSDPEWARYQAYGPPGIGGACVNAGSRNTDVIVARIDANLIVGTPTSYKQLDQRRAFAFSLTNGTDTERFYRLTVTNGAAVATFSMDPDVDVDTGDLSLLAYSSTSRVIYVDQGAASAVSITVQEIDALGGAVVPGGESGVIAFNPDSTNPVVTGLGETQNPFVSNPFVSNPFVSNPFVSNPFVSNSSPSNPFVSNPFVSNPFVSNLSPTDENGDLLPVFDTTWTVTPGSSDTSASYLAQVNIDNPDQYLGHYAFQLIIHKTSSSGGLDGCSSFQLAQDQILSNLVANPFVSNPFVSNPFVSNPFVSNPFVSNPFVSNATFTVAPRDSSTALSGSSVSGGVGGMVTMSAATTAPHQDSRAPLPPEEIKITLRAFQLTGSPPSLFEPTIDPPSVAIVPLSCDPADPAAGCNVAVNAPDLVPGPIAAPSEPVTAGQPFDFPLGGWTLTNVGNQDAEAENRPLRHGFYLSTDSVFDASDIALGTVLSTDNPLGAGASEIFGSSALVIPSDTTPGDYFIILYVDDLEEVSEVDEINNFTTPEAIVALVVESSNTAPEAQDASFSINEDGVLEGVLKASDDDGDALAFSVTISPSSGTVVLVDATTGEFIYTPAADFFGADSFGFVASDGELDSNVATVAIDIAPVNDAPVATDAQFVTAEDTVLEGALGAEDVDDDDLVFTLLQDGTIGTATLAPDGSLTYAPNANLNGQDTLTFSVSDGILADEGTLMITVTPVADPPVAVAQSVVVQQNSEPVTITLQAVDVDGDTLTFSIQTQPTSGTVSALTQVPPMSATVLYEPAPNFVGADSFVFSVSDGVSSSTATVAIEVADLVPDRGFLGLLSPWKSPPPIYSVKEGSSVPLRWHYTDPATGAIVDSQTAMPEVRVTGPFPCSGSEGTDTLEQVFFPGNSGFQYDSQIFMHQFNWKTDDLPTNHCYNIRIFSQETDQLDGPFQIKIKP